MKESRFLAYCYVVSHLLARVGKYDSVVSCLEHRSSVQHGQSGALDCAVIALRDTELVSHIPPTHLDYQPRASWLYLVYLAVGIVQE
eukprot:6187477-Pleurochrysis_carterae.AAC.1